MTDRERFEWLEGERARLAVDLRAVEVDVYTGLAHAGHWKAFREGRVGLWDASMMYATVMVTGAFAEPASSAQINRWADDGGRA